MGNLVQIVKWIVLVTISKYASTVTPAQSSYDCSYLIYFNNYCNSGQYYWNSYGACYQNSENDYYGCSAQKPVFYHTYQYYRYNTNYRAHIYEDCHDRCASCYSDGVWACNSCYAPNYHWIQAGTYQTSETCQPYCPRYSYTTAERRGQYKPLTGQNCALCASSCSWCEDGGSNANCYTCSNNYYSVYYHDDTCDSIFGFDLSSSGRTCPTPKRCYQSCSDYHFSCNASQSSNYSYTYYPRFYHDSGTTISIRRDTNICLLCNYQCRTCTDDGNDDCSQCTINSYLWVQATTTCDHYCPTGDFETSGSRGQFIPSYNFGYCYPCNQGCRLCTTNSDNCYLCQQNAFLIDDKQECASRFLNSQCPRCNQIQSQFLNEGCQIINKKCMLNSCPEYFYFQTYRNYNQHSSNQSIVDQSSQNPLYEYYTKNMEIDNGYITGAANNHTETWYYRYQSNLCMLCDYRCIKCHGPTNENCSQCVNGYYLWKQTRHMTTCQDYCPTGGIQSGTQLGEYIETPDSGYCEICDEGCRFCALNSSNCYLCQQSAFLVDDFQMCNSKFLNGSCPRCTEIQGNFSGQGCQVRDKICKLNSCPQYFYFQTYYHYDENSLNQSVVDQSSQNPQYQFYTRNSEIDNGYITGAANNNSETWYYRYESNLCMLCDYRCVKCHGPTNENCTECANGFYLLNGSTTCSVKCPIGQYRYQPLALHSVNDPASCKQCDSQCLLCSDHSSNCTACYVNISWSDWNDYFYYINSSGFGRCVQSCPETLRQNLKGKVCVSNSADSQSKQSLEYVIAIGAGVSLLIAGVGYLYVYFSYKASSAQVAQVGIGESIVIDNKQMDKSFKQFEQKKRINHPEQKMFPQKDGNNIQEEFQISQNIMSSSRFQSGLLPSSSTLILTNQSGLKSGQLH